MIDDRGLKNGSFGPGQLTAVEQRQPQPVKDRRHVATGTRHPAPQVGGDDRVACSVEVAVAEPVGGDAGDRDDLHQRVPLQRDVERLQLHRATGIHEPGVEGGAMTAGDDTQAQIEIGHQVGGDDELASDQQPRRERAGLAERVSLPSQGQVLPATGPVQLRAE